MKVGKSSFFAARVVFPMSHISSTFIVTIVTVEPVRSSKIATGVRASIRSSDAKIRNLGVGQ
jgi:hypothetical protein